MIIVPIHAGLLVHHNGMPLEHPPGCVHSVIITSFVFLLGLIHARQATINMAIIQHNGDGGRIHPVSYVM